MFARNPIALPCALALCATLLVGGVPATAWHAGTPVTRGTAPDPKKLAAARLMERSLASIKALRTEKSLPIDPAIDPNRVGIIGDEFSPLTTSLGEADAKRTSASPAFAAVMVDYFRAAGAGPGDVVAVAASGSFPGLLLATLCASRTLDIEPVVVYSIGSSMYGANLAGFTFVDMLGRLRQDGLLPYRLAAVSPGGSDDAGSGVLFDDDGGRLREETGRAGLPLVSGSGLEARVADRLRIYDEARRGRPIRCFVNVGGSAAGYGDSEASLAVPNGLVRALREIPSIPTRGLVFEFAARRVPVVHLLFVRGLARDNHVPFDPVPLPPVGEGEVYASR